MRLLGGFYGQDEQVDSRFSIGTVVFMIQWIWMPGIRIGVGPNPQNPNQCITLLCFNETWSHKVDEVLKDVAKSTHSVDT